MRHATRECEIQKQLSHPRIVRLRDVFELSSEGFCTVLDYCDGGDLEQLLKAHKTLPGLNRHPPRTPPLPPLPSTPTPFPSLEPQHPTLGFRCRTPCLSPSCTTPLRSHDWSQMTPPLFVRFQLPLPLSPPGPTYLPLYANGDKPDPTHPILHPHIPGPTKPIRQPRDGLTHPLHGLVQTAPSTT